MKVEHQGQLILTTEQIASAYGTDTNNIKNNFNRNTDRFVYGEDYHKLEGVELKDFLQVTNCDLQISNMVRSLMLWTERGALKHMKMLGTDEAWAGPSKVKDARWGHVNSYPEHILGRLFQLI